MNFFNFLSLSVLFLINFINASIDSVCYSEVSNFTNVLVNFTSCGPIRNYKKNFATMDVDGNNNVSLTEYGNGCFKRFEEQLFCLMDSNQDGVITLKEFIVGDQQRIIASGLMNFIDTNKNKVIDESEMLSILDVVNINATNLNLALTNFEYTFPLSYPDFINFARQLPNATLPCKTNMSCEPAADSYWTIFGQIDANKDGNISVSELMNSNYVMGYENETFNDLDLNADGQIEKFEWEILFKTAAMKADFKAVNFTGCDTNSDSKWNKTELSNYLIDHGLEIRHAWYIMYKYKGPISSDIAYDLSKTLPNPNFRKIVLTDSEVLNSNYVKGTPYYLRNVSIAPI